MTGKRLKVAIVGGGIGGLSAAHAMLQRGINATVWEQGDPLVETGTGIMVFHNALRQLQRMRLGDALSEVGARIGEGSGFRRMDGSFVSPTVIADSSGWNGMYGMHRADLLRVLAEGLPSGVVRRGRRCIGFQQDALLAQLEPAMSRRPTSSLPRMESSRACSNTSSRLRSRNIPARAPIGAGYRGIWFPIGRTRPPRSGWAMASTSWCIPSGAVGS
ncbi:hypothetical protein GGD65_006896 [Bradyrhizobium sp. CIR18]|uniref:FAD-dependent oxidoreductase n=1 Tax=Bradyrhizobium sp. CIR18 TaxID=2663839 RepID=UPI0017A03E54|nr:NAD(P)-binding protein [Bradyrhizobium sp. CIR18]MBB4365827.1 hypothetical protein [Bradyrhizobium sp. CIR18]